MIEMKNAYVKYENNQIEIKRITFTNRYLKNK